MGQECGVIMANPFIIGGNRITITDIKNTLVQSRHEIELALEAIERSERTQTADSEMQMITTLSGTEITLSRCFDLIRKRYV